MAKEIKVYRGSNATASTTFTTIYTVPAGRVARVLLEYLVSYGVSAGNQAILRVGGQDIFGAANSVGTGVAGFPAVYMDSSATEYHPVTANPEYHLAVSSVVPSASSPTSLPQGASGIFVGHSTTLSLYLHPMPKYVHLSAGQTLQVAGEIYKYSFTVIEEY